MKRVQTLSVIFLLIGNVHAQWFKVQKLSVFAETDSLYQVGNFDSAYEKAKLIYFDSRDKVAGPDTPQMIQAAMRASNICHAENFDCSALHWTDILFPLAYGADSLEILKAILPIRSNFKEAILAANKYCITDLEQKYKYQLTRYFKITNIFKTKDAETYLLRIDGGNMQCIDTLVDVKLILMGKKNGVNRNFRVGGYGKLNWVNANYSQWEVTVYNIKDSTYLPQLGDLLECTVGVPEEIKADNPYDKIILYHIRFLDNEWRNLLDLNEIYSKSYDNMFYPHIRNLLAAIREVPTLKNKEISRSMKMKITAGIFKGKNLGYAMKNTSREHLWTFLRYVGAEYKRYAGQDFRISETYATWLKYGSPADGGTLCRLLINVKKDEQSLLLTNYKSEIKKSSLSEEWKKFGLENIDIENFTRCKAIEKLLMHSAKVLQMSENVGKSYSLTASRFSAKKIKDSARYYYLLAADAFKKAGFHFEESSALLAASKIGEDPLPIIHLQEGHNVEFFTVFSHDGNYFASSGLETEIKIWDARSGRELFGLKGHNAWVSSLEWSQDNKHLISADKDGRLIVWDLDSKQQIFKKEFGIKIKDLKFTPDFKYLSMVARSPDLFFLDAQDFTEKFKLKGGGMNLNGMIFIPETKELFTASQDKIIRKWDYEKRKLLDTLRCLNRPGGLFYNPFSGTLMASCIGKTMMCWDIYSNNNHKYRGYFDCDERIIDLSGDTIIYPGAGGFTTDGRYFFFNQKSENITVWDVLNNKTRSFVGFSEYTEEFSMSPDGKWLLMAGEFGLQKLDLTRFSFDKDKELHLTTIPFFGKATLCAQFGADACNLYYFNNGYHRMNLSTGKESLIEKKGYMSRTCIAVTPDKMYYLFYDPFWSNRVEWRSIKNDSIKFVVQLTSKLKTAVYSKSNHWFASIDIKSVLHLYKPNDMEFHDSLKLVNPDEWPMSGVFFRNDSLLLVTAGDKGYVYEVYPELKLKHAFIVPNKISIKIIPINNVFYQNNIVLLSKYGHVFEYDADKNTIDLKLESDSLAGTNFSVAAAEISHKRDWLFVSMDNLKIYKIYLPDFKRTVLPIALKNEAIYIDFSRDDKQVVVTDFHQISVFKTDSVIPSYSIYPLRNREALIITPTNCYFTPKKSLEAITFDWNRKYYPAEQFDQIYNRPDLVLKAMGCADKNLISAYEKAWQKRMNKLGKGNLITSINNIEAPKVNIVNPHGIAVVSNQQRLKFKVHVKDEKDSINRLFLWVNNVPDFGSEGKILQEKVRESWYNIDLALNPGDNKIQVSCMNKNGVESEKEVIYVRYEPLRETKPNLYLLVMSVSEYKDTKYNLKYAVKDGRDFAGLYAKPDSTLKALYNSIYIDTVFDKNVGRNALDSMMKRLPFVRVNDEVILYVSGHGMLDDKFNFYYASHDMNFEKPAENGIPYENLESFLERLGSRKKMLLIDACHSGELDKEEVEISAISDTFQTKEGNVVTRAGSNICKGCAKPKLGTNSFELMQQLFSNPDRGSGAAVITAASGTSFALESPEWNNGIFTWSIIHGLRDFAADINKNGKITINELNDYVIEQVNQKTHGLQKPTTRRLDPEFDRVIWE